MSNRPWTLPEGAEPEQGSRRLAAQGNRWAFPLRRLIVVQAVVVGAAAALGGLDGVEAARSAFAGAVICGIANIYAAWRVFAAKRRHVSEYGELANLYRAEFGKLVVIGALSAVVFSVSSVEILAYIGGCLGALLAGTLVAATFNPAATANNSKIKDTHGE